MNKILIVEDVWDIDEILTLNLERAGFQIFTINTLIEDEKINEISPDLILLHFHLLNKFDSQFTQEIRKYIDRIIVFVTMYDSIEQTLEKLVVDGHTTKLFHTEKVATHIQEHLKMNESKLDELVIEIDNLRIDINQKEVYKDGQIINLYTKEKKLLFYLVKNANKVISSQQIIYDIWGRDEKTNEKTVVVHISTLRRKLGDSYSKGNWIQTVRGFGYKFVIN